MMAGGAVVVFDFDGVIVDSFDVCLRLQREVDPELTEAEFRAWFLGNVFDALKKKYGKAKGSELDWDYFEKYLEEVIGRKPTEGIGDLFRRLRSEGRRLYLISSTGSDQIRRYLERYGLLDFFEKIYGPEAAKSKVEKLRMVAKDAGVEAGEMIFVSDTVGDLVEAEKAGARGIGVDWGFHDRATLEKAGVEIVSDVDGLGEEVEKRIPAEGG